MPEEKLASELQRMGAKNVLVLDFSSKNYDGISEEEVKNVFLSCLFKDGELSKGVPVSDCVIAEGITFATVFCAERLAQNSANIQRMISNIENIDKGVSFTGFFKDKTGRNWTQNTATADFLLMLGLANDDLFYITVEREIGMLYGNVPFIAQTPKKDSKKEQEDKPKKFVKTKDETREADKNNN